MSELAADIERRLTELLTAVDDLLGDELLALDGRPLVDQLGYRVADRAARLAAAVTGADTKSRARAIASLGQLVDLDDPADAATPAGIALGQHATDTVTQVYAAAVLGVSRARVNVLLKTGRLAEADDRAVTRASLAARLAARSQPGT